MQSTLSKHFNFKGKGEKLGTAKPSPSRDKPAPSAFAQKRRENLKATASETIDILPKILRQIPHIDACASSVHHFKDYAPLDPRQCPGFELPNGDPQVGKKGTRIRVHDQDSFDAALQLQRTTVRDMKQNPKPKPKPKPHPDSEDIEMKDAPPSPTTPTPKAPQDQTPSPANNTPPASPTPKPVAVLNLANAYHPGGGFLRGALAQEEALCYRSSLSLSLSTHHYPIPTLSALYTPTCVIIRDAMSRGHDLLYPKTAPDDLPVTSVISVAAINRPRLADDGTYLRDYDIEIMKYKIRMVLRLAAGQGHRKLVLGALGCGAFENPPGQVAQLFVEVFQEGEFRGGWWEDVVFAVLDSVKGAKGGKDGEGNFGIFYRALHGMIV
jgi:uncharacterized protein (TIGR02452 family)